MDYLKAGINAKINDLRRLEEDRGFMGDKECDKQKQANREVKAEFEAELPIARERRNAERVQ